MSYKPNKIWLIKYDSFYMTHLCFRIVCSHFEFNVYNIIPTPTEKMLHHNQWLIEEIGQEDQSKIFVHFANSLANISIILITWHIVPWNRTCEYFRTCDSSQFVRTDGTGQTVTCTRTVVHYYSMIITVWLPRYYRGWYIST